MGKAKKERAKANQLRKMNMGNVESYLEKISVNKGMYIGMSLMRSCSSSIFFVYDYAINKCKKLEECKDEKSFFDALGEINVSLLNYEGFYSVSENMFVFSCEEKYTSFIEILEKVIKSNSEESSNPEHTKIYSLFLEGFKQNKIAKRFKNNAE